MVTRERIFRARLRGAMLLDQGGVCRICRREYQPRWYCLDHDHALEKEGYGYIARGVLCTRCNRALGQFEQSDAAIEGAVQYLLSIQQLRKDTRSNERPAE